MEEKEWTPPADAVAESKGWTPPADAVIEEPLKKKEPTQSKEDLTSTSVSGGLKSDSLTPEIPTWKDKVSTGLPAGVKKQGNIDLTNRPVVKNGDKKSTVLSFSIGTDEGEVLIPQVVNGKILSQEDAIRHYEKTGEHLGIFSSVDAANKYAEQLHKDEEARVNVSTWKDSAIEATKKSEIAFQDKAKGKDKLQTRVEVVSGLAEKAKVKAEQLSSQVFQMDNYIKTLEGQAGKEQELNKAIENRNALAVDLNKEIKKQDIFTKRAQQTQQTIDEIPLGAMESAGNSISNIATSLKMAIPQSQLAVTSIADKLNRTGLELYLKLSGSDLSDGEIKQIASMGSNVASEAAAMVPGMVKMGAQEQIDKNIAELDYYRDKMKPTAGVIESYEKSDIPGMAAASSAGFPCAINVLYSSSPY